MHPSYTAARGKAGSSTQVVWPYSSCFCHHAVPPSVCQPDPNVRHPFGLPHWLRLVPQNMPHVSLPPAHTTSPFFPSTESNPSLPSPSLTLFNKSSFTVQPIKTSTHFSSANFTQPLTVPTMPWSSLWVSAGQKDLIPAFCQHSG